MDAKKLEILMTAVDLGSFSKASEVVGYTQSGLTHLVDSLEREIGFPLIRRSYSGIALTEAGENLLPDIRKYIDNVNLFYSPLPVCISTSVYESLSEEDQAILKEAAQEAAKETRENNDATAEKMESDLTSQGMTIVSSEDVDTEAFQSAVQPCYDEMESYIGSEWVDQIKSLTGTEG